MPQNKKRNKSVKKQPTNPPPRPASKQARVPKPQPRRKEEVPHPLVHFSAHHSSGHMPSSHPHGPYVAINSHLIATAAHAPNVEYFYFLTWTPTTTLLAMIAGQRGVTNPYSGGSYSGVQLGQTDAASPLSIKPLRMSLKMCNSTATLTMSGMCFATPFSNPLPINWVVDNPANNYLQLSAVDVDVLRGVVLNAKDTLSIPSRDLSGHHFVCPPSNEVAFEKFLDFFPNAVGGNDENKSFQDGYNSVLSNPPMVTWVIYFPPTVGAQEINLSVRRSDACKYPIASALTSTAIAPPMVTQQVQTSVVRSAQTAVLAGHTSDRVLSGLSGSLESQAIRFGGGLIRGAGHLLEMGASSVFGRLAARIAPRALALL